MRLELAIEISAKLVAVLAMIQSLEFLATRASWGTSGAWRFDDLKQEWGSSLLEKLLWVFLNQNSFFILQILRIGLASFVFYRIHWVALLGLFLMHFLTLLRFRGSYNGGSDYMNLLVLICLTVTVAFREIKLVPWVAFGYLAIQLILSYSKAGWMKLRIKSWRTTLALESFLRSSSYSESFWVDRLLQSKKLLLGSSWAILGFELLFPLSILHPKLALGFMTVGFCFHLANAYVFGLNRFILSWLAAYPALYFMANHFNFFK